MLWLTVGLIVVLCASVLAEAKTTVGLILIGSIHDQGWSQTHYENMLAAVEICGDDVELVIQEEVWDPMFTEVARDMILSDNVDIIFAASATYQGFISVLADEFPEVMWEFTDPSVVEPKDNVRGYYVRFYEGNFIAGVAVGRLLAKSSLPDDSIVGLVSSIAFPLTVRNANAAIAGVRYGLGSDIPAKVAWLGSVSDNPWFNPEQEALLARTLISGGAVALNSYLDSTAVIEVAEDLSVLSWGITRDNTPFGLTTNVANSVVDWTAYYADRVQRLINGTWDAGSTWAHMLGEPRIELGPLAGFLTLDIAREIWTLQEEIASGDFVVLSELSELELLTSMEFLPGLDD